MFGAIFRPLVASRRRRAALIGLRVPKEEIDGRCLDLVAVDGDSCAGR